MLDYDHDEKTPDGSEMSMMIEIALGVGLGILGAEIVGTLVLGVIARKILERWGKS